MLLTLRNVWEAQITLLVAVSNFSTEVFYFFSGYLATGSRNVDINFRLGASTWQVFDSHYEPRKNRKLY